MPIEIYRSPPFLLEGYRAFTVKYDDGTRGTILEHREVMEKKLGRKLQSGELVHHEDRDKLNNDPGNLKVKTRSSHGKLHAKVAPLVKVQCLQCGVVFERPARIEQERKKRGSAGPFCGNSCKGKWGRQKQIANGTGPSKRTSIHGTVAMYRYCKCELCRAANTQRSRDLRKRKKTST
jgi:hypothetical protein